MAGKAPMQVEENLREVVPWADEGFRIETYTDDFLHLPGHALRLHWHDLLEVDLVVSGHVCYHVDGVDYPLVAGDVLALNAGALHRAESRDNALVRGTSFDPALLGGPGGLIDRRYAQNVTRSGVSAVRLPAGSDEARGVGDTLRDMQALERGADLYELRLLECVARLCLSLFPLLVGEGEPGRGSATARRETEAKAMIAYVDEHFADRITIEDLCRAGRVSRSGCFRAFGRFASKAPLEYVNEVRLAHASALLGQTGRSVGDIALTCGFGTASYFSQLFRRAYGMTPNAYRRRHS